ncbi:unnamed protein product [Ectocarpus sp. CCAP 1310/34]|nr:unnamed protein product [Ectocarpus sp. CCAP 1310/34]
MNLKEHVLEELELHEYYVRDALQCLLHTILFVRAPGSLRPRESHCENFGLSFARCGARDVDVAVDRALEEFWRSLRPAGPDLSKGWIAVSFFMRREKKSFGLFLKEEKVVWEQWVVPVLVNTSPRPTEADDTSVLARGRLQEMAVRLVQGRMLDILTSVNDCIDHVPPVGTEYEFEMMSAPKEDRRESVYARLMQAPSPLNL